MADKSYLPLANGDDDGMVRHDAALAGIQSTLRNLRAWLWGLTLAVAVAAAFLVSSAWYSSLPESQKSEVREEMLLVSIPVCALFFTWFHIWLAIQMMFLPLNFLGIWQYRDTGVGIGWQGVVPRKSIKMAKMAFAKARPYLLGPRQWLGRVDSKVLVDKGRPHLQRIVGSALASVCKRHFPDMDRRMPPEVLEELTAAAVEKIQDTSPHLWQDLTELLCDDKLGIDNDGMIVKVFQENKELLNHFFMSLGDREFRFIEHCGACLGFVCGCLQLFAFNHLDAQGRAIFLPLTGFVLGIGTNWMAIQMCFKPCIPIPIRICGRHVFDIQGLFLKRQKDVAIVYSRLLCDNFFDFQKVVNYLQTLPELWVELKGAYLDHNSRVMRQILGPTLSWMAPLALGQREFRSLEADIRLALVERMAEADDLHKVSGNYIQAASDIFRSNAKALQHMPPDEFEDLLHPVFQEDEWILVLLGGVLGAFVGFVQVYFLSS